MNEALTYSWKPRFSVFGQVYAPYAIVELEDSNHQWQEFVMKIDSGAVVTAMNVDDYTFLGYTINTDRETLLSDAQGNSLPVYIYELNVRFGSYIVPSVPIAFATNKISELLLGRQGIFDFFDINLKGKSFLTDFTLAP